MAINENRNPKIESAFEGINVRYKSIFKILRPRINSTGYTERNQTCNFCAAFLQNNSEAAAWYEYPINNKEHVDAIIFDPSDNVLYFVEAKRYNSHKKVDEICDDIKRCLKEADKIEKGIGGNYGKEVLKVYIVILADLWTEDSMGEHWKIEYWTEVAKEEVLLPDEVNDLLITKIRDILPSPKYQPYFCYTGFSSANKNDTDEIYKDEALEEYKLLCVYTALCPFTP